MADEPIMQVHSAGILLFRHRAGRLEVLLAHPGGPFWAGRDDGAWTIPKGLPLDEEQRVDAACREFREETGFVADGELIALGELRQPNGKIVHVWALEKDVDADAAVSNSFEMEWPRHSGVQRSFPEVDRVAWFSLPRARRKIIRGQAGFLERLVERLGTAF
jgi:predicted NUDIX family NTP pyrophosphohydrolase